MKLAHVTATAADESGYPVAITAGAHRLRADERAVLGGRDTGPAPFELLLSALVACTAITLRMYAQRKHWPLETVHVTADLTDEEPGQRITRVLRLDGALGDDQLARLLDIAERTPVTKTLRAGVPIETRLAGQR